MAGEGNPALIPVSKGKSRTLSVSDEYISSVDELFSFKADIIKLLRQILFEIIVDVKV